MMTLSDVRKFAPSNKNVKGVYSKEKSVAAWELLNLGRTDRATRIEHFIANEVQERSGYDCHVTAHTCSWDITANLDDKPVKIEVKSALQSKGTECQYQIQNVKSNLFDYLFIVLVTPEGTRVGWAYSKDIRKMCRYKTEHCNGYTLSINARKWDRGEYEDWLHDIDDFPYGP
tara:strand:- start:166 stop:684 length:519 start_codon:yes stop_codon:yes gene_type:complete